MTSESVTVPREPTEAMIEAGHQTDVLLCRPDARTVWTAMLAAAPAATPQGEAVGRYITFSPSSEEGNAVVYPETPADGVYWTLIGSGPDLDQNALAQQIVTRLNMTPPPPAPTGEALPETGWTVAQTISQLEQEAECAKNPKPKGRGRDGLRARTHC